MIEVDIVTPTRKLVEGARTTALRMPGAKGELLVLPGHTDMLTMLGTGVLSLVLDGTERKFAVSYGFAEIRKDKVLVLAETCEEGKDIDVARAKKAQKAAQDVLSGALDIRQGAGPGQADNVLTREHFRKYELKVQRSIVRQQAGE